MPLLYEKRGASPLFLVWKSYEDNLKTLLKTAVALINLIPEEIKYMIVVQLNEEENKNP
jgi:hypothetical protein